MSLNRRPDQSLGARDGRAGHRSSVGNAGGTDRGARAGSPPFPTPPRQCYVQPSPDNDTWPKAVTDSLGATPGRASDLAGATLLANDTGTSLTVPERRPGAAPSGGSIAGTDPVYIHARAGFAGARSVPV